MIVRKHQGLKSSLGTLDHISIIKIGDQWVLSIAMEYSLSKSDSCDLLNLFDARRSIFKRERTCDKLLSDDDDEAFGCAKKKSLVLCHRLYTNFRISEKTIYFIFPVFQWFL